MKPSFIQSSAIEYPNVAGLPMAIIDYRLVDGITDPPNLKLEASEEFLKISDCFLCYTPSTKVGKSEVLEIEIGECPTDPTLQPPVKSPSLVLFVSEIPFISSLCV